jgi:hypothetical protein
LPGQTGSGGRVGRRDSWRSTAQVFGGTLRTDALPARAVISASAISSLPDVVRTSAPVEVRGGFHFAAVIACSRHGEEQAPASRTLWLALRARRVMAAGLPTDSAFSASSEVSFACAG